MTTSPTPPSPLNDDGANAKFASLASQLASRASTTIGAQEWVRGGGYGQPWYTGGQYWEGWNHEHLLLTPESQLLALSNAFARPRCWPNASKRHVTYQLGERPIEYVPDPALPYEDHGAQIVDGVRVYGLDSEHFCSGQVLSLRRLNPPTIVSGLKWGDDTLPDLTIGQLADAAVHLLQDSNAGEMMTWMANTKDGLSVRPPDRVTARLTWVALRCAEEIGLDGWNETIVRYWLDNVARWIMPGPHWQTTKDIGTSPDVTLPYWNPVHSYGYMVPTIWKLLQKWGGILPPNTRLAFQAWLPDAAKSLDPLIGENGETPWAVDALGVKGYMTGGNGDQYTPGYEVYTALRIAVLLPGVTSTSPKAAAILNHLGAKATDPLYSPWLCDANFKCVVAP